MLFFLSIILMILIICAAWRLACKKYNIPWPYWLAWVLRNPYMLVFCHPNEIVKRVAPLPNSRVLDLGCGAGRISVPIAKQLGESGSLLGVDLQKLMISKADAHALKQGVSEKCSFRQLDITGASITERFDRVVIVTVLGEIPNVEFVVEKISSLLNSGAVVSVTEVIPDPCYITKAKLRNLFENHGFKVDQLFEGPLSYTMNFVRA